MENQTPSTLIAIDNSSLPDERRDIHTQAIGMLVADLRFITLALVIAIGLTNLPYVYAYATTPDGMHFMGFVQNMPDSGEYLAWMRESMNSILISNTLTSESNPPLFFNLVFWILGRLAAHTIGDLVQWLTFFRIVSGILVIVTAYYFCSLFIADRLQRRTAFCLIVFSSGLSVYIAIFNKVASPINFSAQFIAEGTTLYSMMSFPLLAYSAFLIMLILGWSFIAYQQASLRWACAAGIAALILGWSHGYDLLSIYGVLGAFTILVTIRNRVSWIWIKSVALIVGISCFPGIYFFVLTKTNAVWRDSLSQFANAGVFSPDPLQLVLLLGLPLIVTLASYDGFIPLQKHSSQDLFLKTWFGVQFFLIYLPVEYQIHFINGFQVPVALLATNGLSRHLVPRIAQWRLVKPWNTSGKLFPVLAAFLILATVPSSIYFVGWRLNDMSRHPSPYFLQADQVRALHWLNEHSSPDHIVLSSNDIGSFIPGLTGNRPFLSHWAMTLNFYSKREIVNRFFDSAATDAERIRIIQEYNISHVFWSDAERTLGAWNPDTATFLERDWSGATAVVYRIKR